MPVQKDNRLALKETPCGKDGIVVDGVCVYLKPGEIGKSPIPQKKNR